MGEFKEGAVRVDAVLRPRRVTLNALQPLSRVERVALVVRTRRIGDFLAHPVGLLVVAHFSGGGGVLEQTALPAENERMVVAQPRARC